MGGGKCCDEQYPWIVSLTQRIVTRGRFHQHFRSSFCKRWSQSCKKTVKTWLSFYTFGINAWGQFHQYPTSSFCASWSHMRTVLSIRRWSREYLLVVFVDNIGFTFVSETDCIKLLAQAHLPFLPMSWFN